MENSVGVWIFFWDNRPVQVSIKKAGYMDVKEITSQGVYLDMLAGDGSILRKVFGMIS